MRTSLVLLIALEEAALRGRVIVCVVGYFAGRIRQAMSQRAVDFTQEQAAHFVSGGLVEPIEKPPAPGRLAQSLVGLEASLGKELFDLRHRLQPFALPPAIPP